MPTTARPDLLDGPFLGTDALAQGLLTPRTLRGSAVRRLLRGVYVPTGLHVDHHVMVQAATLLAPAGAAVSGRSAAVVHGCELAHRHDPVTLSVSRPCSRSASPSGRTRRP